MIIRLFVLILSLFPFLFTASCQPRPETATVPVAEKTIFDYIAENDTTGFIHWIETASDLDLRDADGATPLLNAIIHERSGYVIDLIGQGANVNLADNSGAAPLHVAAMLGKTAIVKLLIDAGADFTATNNDGLTAYDLAKLLNQSEAAAAFEEARAALLRPLPIETETAIADVLEPEIPPAVLLSTDFRIWTSHSGEKMDAAFIKNVFDVITLQNRDGEFFRIPLNRLSGPDQITIRQLTALDPHTLARARSPNIGKTRAAPTDSIALKIGRDKGWTVLENCRLKRSGGNDGDSFHVVHDGKEYIFRLYFVDAAETVMSFPDRVRHQSEYFGLNDSDTIKLGEDAKKYTLALLAGGSFTVVTQWLDAKGSSRLPRYFAMVVTSQGDLDELLVQEGLVRRYGMPVRNNYGERKNSALKKLEKQAMDQKVGAWSKR